jgi:hypothetical protein
MQLSRQVGQQLGMAGSVNLAAQNLLRTRDRQRSDLVTKHIARALHCQRRLFLGRLARGRYDAGTLGSGFVERLGNLAFAGRTDFGCARAR